MQPLLQKFQTYLHLRGETQRSDRQGPRTILVERATTRVAPTTTRVAPTNSPKRGEGSDLVGKISPSSIKNYVSDINHFLNFIAGSIQETIVQPVHITPAAIKAYTAAAAGQLSPSSLNRHLSSLRYFGKFLLAAKLCETDPTQNLTNPAFDPTLAQVITRYQKFLTSEDLSKSTIKNYVSDLKKYLLWARKNIKTTDEGLNARPLI
ncbi:site-specific integrase [Microgenomates group bacterium]|nr:site-specific integrase [Microgenomates group bacterium]